MAKIQRARHFPSPLHCFCEVVTLLNYSSTFKTKSQIWDLCQVLRICLLFSWYIYLSLVKNRLVVVTICATLCIINNQLSDKIRVILK